MEMKKKDSYVRLFVGTSYSLQDIQTVGELKKGLQAILADLPEDDSLKVSDHNFHNGKFDYTLSEGITQED